MTDCASTVLIVDDEDSIRRMLKRALEKESFNVLLAADGAEMHRHLASSHVDLITLDLTLGNENGLELAREVRAKSSTPIIIVSGKGELIDTVVGLEVGADDYVSKPFELRELIARIRAVLRRYQSSTSDTEPAPPSKEEVNKGSSYAFLGWTLDPAVRELRDSSHKVCELTTGEYDLLLLLVIHSRKVMSRDQIMDQLRGTEWSPNDRTIDNQIARLRKKLQADDTQSPLIKTVRGAGYLFTPDVTTGS